jgi:hypothetical protein
MEILVRPPAVLPDTFVTAVFAKHVAWRASFDATRGATTSLSALTGYSKDKLQSSFFFTEFDGSVHRGGSAPVAAGRLKRRDPNELIRQYGDLIDAVVRGRPADLVVAVHMCRGNAGRGQAAGGYEPLCPQCGFSSGAGVTIGSDATAAAAGAGMLARVHRMSFDEQERKLAHVVELSARIWS